MDPINEKPKKDLFDSSADSSIDKKRVVDCLDGLVHLDIDAVRAYGHAIEKCDKPEYQEIKDQLSRFRSDHERHVSDLSACITRYGGKAPEFKPDLKGVFLEGFTAVRSMTGIEGALKAMKTNEQLTNRKYDEAIAIDLPSDVSMIVQRNRDDERRHLQYIEDCLSRQLWKAGKAA